MVKYSTLSQQGIWANHYARKPSVCFQCNTWNCHVTFMFYWYHRMCSNRSFCGRGVVVNFVAVPVSLSWQAWGLGTSGEERELPHFHFISEHDVWNKWPSTDFHTLASFQPLFLYLTTSGVRWAKGKRLHIFLIFSCAQCNESETADMLYMFTHSSTYSTWSTPHVSRGD